MERNIVTFGLRTKVFHPEYGKGKIIAIAEDLFAKRVREYYIIHIPERNMYVEVPTEKADEVGLRPISEPVAIDVMWATLQSDPAELPADEQLRKAEVEGKLQTGDLFKIAQVVRDLRGFQQQHKLGQADRDFLAEAEDFLAEEVALAQDWEPKEALDLLQSSVQSVES